MPRALLLLTTACVAAATIVAAVPAHARASSESLLSGERLTAGQQLVDLGATLTMQSDGNLVVVVEQRVVWSTGTVGHAGAVLTMQTDGNLVIRGADGAAVWSTGTLVEPGAIATLDDSGALVLSSPREGHYWDNDTGAPLLLSVLVSGRALRSGDDLHGYAVSPCCSPHGVGLYVTRAGGLNVVDAVNGGYARVLEIGDQGSDPRDVGTLTMQTDGNLVLRRAGAAATWASRTSGAGLRLVVQSDGNLVIRDPAGHAVWSAGVSTVLLAADESVRAGRVFLARNPEQPSGRVEFGTDGDLRQYDPYGRLIWTSRTAGNPGATLSMQHDGNLVIRAASGRAVWSTGTAGCGVGRYLDTRTMTVSTTHGYIWAPAQGRIRC